MTFGNDQQVSGIPVVFISALEGRGRTNVLHQVTDTYEKWCSRLPTARLNRWLCKVVTPLDVTFCLTVKAKHVFGSKLSSSSLICRFYQVTSRHSWKDQAAQPKIKYFTQVKARPPTFVAFVRGKTQLSDTDIRFLTKSLKEDFDLGGIPIRIMQRFVTNKDAGRSSKNSHSVGKVAERILSDKRSVLVE